MFCHWKDEKLKIKCQQACRAYHLPLGPSGHLPPRALGGGGVVCVRVERGREGGGGGLPQSAFTKPADLTFVRPGPAVRCQALLCDWRLCAVDLGSVLVSCDWLLISPQLPVCPDEGLSPSGSRPPVAASRWFDSNGNVYGTKRAVILTRQV